MVWPWLAQAAKAWGSARRRVPCRQEIPRAPVAMVVAAPAGVADPAAAETVVAVETVVVVETVAVETAAVVAPAAAVRFRHTNN